MYDDAVMQRAIALSALALTTPGTQPFGAVVVKDGRVVGEGLNHAKAHHDPTSHGEIEAIRDACRTLKTVDLSGCDLYASCEPCPMCVAAMTVAGVARLYYAVGMDQAGAVLAGVSAAKRHSVDVAAVRAAAGARLADRRLPAEQHRADDAAAVLRDWAAQ